jgi:hypothetical protein
VEVTKYLGEAASAALPLTPCELLVAYRWTQMLVNAWVNLWREATKAFASRIEHEAGNRSCRHLTREAFVNDDSVHGKFSSVKEQLLRIF